MTHGPNKRFRNKAGAGVEKQHGEVNQKNLVLLKEKMKQKEEKKEKKKRDDIKESEDTNTKDSKNKSL